MSGKKPVSYLTRIAVLTAAGARLCGGAPAVINASDQWISENDGRAIIYVRRNGDTNSRVSVSYSTADATARAGVDYVATSGTLVFAAGEVSKNFTVPIIDNGLLNGTRSVQLNLT